MAREQARQALVARTDGVGRGTWRPDCENGPETHGGIGLLVLWHVLTVYPIAATQVAT